MFQVAIFMASTPSSCLYIADRADATLYRFSSRHFYSCGLKSSLMWPVGRRVAHQEKRTGSMSENTTKTHPVDEVLPLSRLAALG
jgi:hypothetical protein